MSRCEEIREDLVAYDRGELDSLRGQRVKAHLGHCHDCRRASQQLSAAMAAARVPIEVGALETEQLVERLGPWLERRSAGPSRWLAAGLVAAAAAVAVMTLRVPESPPASLEHLALQTDLRIIGRGLQSGERPDTSVLVLEEGFAVVNGSASPPVVTPELELRAGSSRARFWVERRGEASWFEVISGRLVAKHRGVERTVEPGRGWVATETALRPGRASAPEAVAYLADPFLGLPGDRSAVMAATPDTPELRRSQPAKTPAPRRSPPRRRSRPPRKAKPLEPPEAPAIPAHRRLVVPEPPEEAPPLGGGKWREAESWARRGRWPEALARYRALAREHDGALGRFARLECARILGLRMERRAEARELLAALLTETLDDEVGRQARFTRCEIMRGDDACRAQSCLRQLARSDTDAEEAAATLQRWSRSEIDCPEIKTESSDN